METPYIRRILEKTATIAGLGAASYGAYLSYDSTVTGTLISLAGCTLAIGGAASRSGRIRTLESIAEADTEAILTEETNA